MTVQNADRLRRKLERMAAVKGPVRARIREALASVGAEVSGQMRAVAPVRSGALKASIKVVFGAYRPDNANVRGVGGAGAGDPDLTMRVVAGDATAWYARFVEFGTAPHEVGGKFEGAQHPGAAPHPFFFPVWRANKRRAKARVTRAMKQGVRESIGA